MIAAHPWLGVGPDNFRLLYGNYSPLVRADPRVHSNNMYLEVVAGGGLAAGSCLAWLLWRSGRLARAGVRRSGDGAVVGTAAAAACAAIAVHGTADSFLSFTATYILFAVVLGLLVSNHMVHHVYAHRL
jgi:O-antigen ligase